MKIPVRGKSLLAYSVFPLLFFAILLVTHWKVLDLPYFWDELGQFIPAALDVFEKGAWVPESTLPNVHPPGVMAYLAAVWKIAGYSVIATRVAMLALAAAGVFAAFLLAIEMCRDFPGLPAFIVPLLLLSSPLFWAQSMLAQLDMPAMVFTCLAVLLFITGRIALCVAACTLLVLVKESSLAVPLAFAVVLLYERRFGHACLFLIPALAIAGWLAVLKSATGHLFGNQEFTHYNVWFQLHPVRLPLTIIRRIFYLFIDNFHWVGTAVVLWALWRRQTFRARAWAVILLTGGLQTLVVSILGGAALERYLMPVIPLFYIAVAAAFSLLTPKLRAGALIVMTAGLISGIFINSPFTYPFENNAAFVTFVRLQQRAAEFVEQKYHEAAVVSAWPFPDALRRPEFGYVNTPMRAQGIDNFNPETLLPLAGKIDVLVIYSRTWESKWGVLRSSWIRRFLSDYYFYHPQITSEQIQRELGLIPVVRWEQRQQWIEIYQRPTLIR